MPALPNQVAITSILSGQPRNAEPVNGNDTALQAAVNALITALSGGAAGQILSAVDGSDVQWINRILYRKTTQKQVVNSIVETDLLNGEVTVAANAIGANGVLRLTAAGDMLNNSGVGQNTPRFKLKLGATTIFDTGSLSATPWSTSPGRQGWHVVVEIANLGAANSQWSSIALDLDGFFAAGNAAFVTGEGTFIATGSGSGYARGVAGGASTEDTTLAKALALTVINPAANASLDVTLKHALVEII